MIVNLYRWLPVDLIIFHPVNLDETITKSDNDPKVRFLRDKIFDAITQLVDWIFDDKDVEDIAQDAWLKFYREVCYKLAKTELPSGYLWRMVINLCMDYFKNGL